MPVVFRDVRRARLRWWAAAMLAATGVLAGGAVLLWWAPLAPLRARAPLPEIVLLDARGEVLLRGSADGFRVPVALSIVSPAFLEAVVATEDQRFWHHPGVDPIALVRAAVRAPIERSGASTITMQVARGRYLDVQRSPLAVRKLRELLLALQIDARHSKAEILEAYVNDAYFGRRAYGVEAAARSYFGVPASELDRAQAALLAGLVQRPGLAAFGDGPDEAARARERYVLDRLVAVGTIAPGEADAVAARPLAFASSDRGLEERFAAGLAPRFVEYALAELVQVLPSANPGRGLVVETTLDGALQRETERAARRQLAVLEPHGATTAAVVAIRPEDGAILAMASESAVGSPTGALNMALQPRQPGSALKPFVYGAALEQQYTAASPLLDVPSEYISALGPYVPANYDLRFRGPVTLRVALASSLNVPAVRMLDAIGLEPVLDIASRVGLTSLSTPEAYGLSLSLGGGEVTPLELTSAYGVLAAGGRRAEPHSITRVRDASGEVLYERPAVEAVRVLDAGVAFLVTDVLSDAEARVPGFGDAAVLETPFASAVKTGTSSGFTDNWTVGYTSDVVVGVWVGNPNGAPMTNVSGISGAAPLWREVLVAAHEGREPRPFDVAAGLERLATCAPTGLLRGSDCPSPDIEWFTPGTVPKQVEEYYRADGRGGLALALDPEARAWAASLDIALAPAAGETTPTSLRPAQGSVLHLTPELGLSRTVLSVAVPPEAVRVEFRIDGRLVGVGEAPWPDVPWALEVGRHTLEVTAVLPSGATHTSTSAFEVRS